MENASKALIMAATVLIGAMIISLGVFLFRTFGGSSKQINDQIKNTQIAEFNSPYYKFEGIETCRVHDVVTIANLARKNNENYYEKNYGHDVYSEPYYITVKVYNVSGSYNQYHFENSDESSMQNFISQYSLKGDNITPCYFKCLSVETSEVTKLVKEVSFRLIN